MQQLTKNHFKNINVENELKKLSNSNSSKSNSSNNSSISYSDSYDTEFDSDSKYKNLNFKNNEDSEEDSEENNNSDNNEESDENNNEESEENDNSDESEEDSNSEKDSEILKIDENDLFNIKTNGNEFYGEVLKNRYMILKKLGHGSFSSVWMAFDNDNNNLVALKIINPDDYKEGILEIEIYNKLKDLDNEYLLTMLEYFQITPIHYKYYNNEDYYNEEDDKNDEDKKKLNDHIVIVLPLLACSAYDLLKCEEYENGLPTDVCKKIMHQLLEGIKELEKNNMMHTDIKPENILICGNNKEVELLLKMISDIDIKKLHDKQYNKIKLLDDDEEKKWINSYNIYKDIAKTLLNFINNDMKDIKNQMKTCKINSSYINNIKIKICDFNLVIDISNKIGNKNIEIQTRYYRSPEIILGHGLHKKTDYWSCGCVLFELLTGDLLFDPKKTSMISRDAHHIYLIEEIIDKIPNSILQNSKKYNSIFKNYKFIDEHKISLKKLFKTKYNNLGLNNSEINNIILFLSYFLKINPENRCNIDEMILLINNKN